MGVGLAKQAGEDAPAVIKRSAQCDLVIQHALRARLWCWVTTALPGS